MSQYGICPKCNLNYIDIEKQEMCNVCKNQITGRRSVVDDFELEEDSEYENNELQSPFEDKIVAIHEQYEEEKEDDEDVDNAVWRSYVEDNDNDLSMSDFSFDEEQEEEAEEEEEIEEDDFEYVSPEEYCADDEDDEDDEDDDEDF